MLKKKRWLLVGIIALAAIALLVLVLLLVKNGRTHPALRATFPPRGEGSCPGANYKKDFRENPVGCVAIYLLLW